MYCTGVLQKNYVFLINGVPATNKSCVFAGRMNCIRDMLWRHIREETGAVQYKK